MKLIVINNNYPETALNKESFGVYTLPDTALLKNGKPFFIPDFAHPCTMQGHLVVKICRLGRSISERFAHRYYDAISVGVTFTAENLLNELKSQNFPWDLAVGFDGAVAIGKLINLYPQQENLSDENIGVNQHFKPLSGDIQFSIFNNEMKIQEGCSQEMLYHIDTIITEISKHYTLRQGDLIFTGCPSLPDDVKLNDRISGYIGTEQVLQFNIK